ncbi:MAG: hypothetical protein ACRDRH_09740 [Pseudonocardia sp.]
MTGSVTRTTRAAAARRHRSTTPSSISTPRATSQCTTWTPVHPSTCFVQRHGLPIAFPELGEDSQRGWYGTPLILQVEIDRPDALHAACRDAGIPVRAQYPDWLASPLLQRTELLTRFWPHVAHTDYRPAARSDLPHYDRLRRQLLVLKIPDVPAPDYMHRAGNALASVLRQCPTTS